MVWWFFVWPRNVTFPFLLLRPPPTNKQLNSMGISVRSLGLLSRSQFCYIMSPPGHLHNIILDSTRIPSSATPPPGSPLTRDCKIILPRKCGDISERWNRTVHERAMEILRNEIMRMCSSAHNEEWGRDDTVAARFSTWNNPLLWWPGNTPPRPPTTQRNKKTLCKEDSQ